MRCTRYVFWLYYIFIINFIYNPIIKILSIKYIGKNLNNLKTTTLKIKPLTDIELENFSEQDLSIRHLLLLKIIDVFKLELVVDEYFSVLVAKYKSIEKIKQPKQRNIIKEDY